MKKILSFISLFLTILLIIAALPVSHFDISAAEDDISYIIWEATPENLSAQSGESVKATMESDAICPGAFDVIKMTDDGSYYRTVMTVTGSGGNDINTVLASGLSNNNRGYGWLEESTVLQAIRPYMTVSFEYRVNATQGSVPSDGLLYFKAAHEYNGKATELCTVSILNTSVWTSYSTVLSGNTFANWYSGYLGFNIYSQSKKFNGSYQIDLRNFRIELRAEDEIEINTALEAKESLWRFDDIVQSDSNFNSHNSIWYASPERLKAENGDSVTGYVAKGYDPARFDTVKAIDENVCYYHTEMNVSGNGGNYCNAVVKSGFNSDTKGFGWLNNVNILNALAPYMYISFEYRFTGTEGLPDDAYIYFGAGSEYGKACDFGVIKEKASKWTEYELKAISGTFSKSWYSGYFTFNIYSYSGGLSGTQSIDIRNVRIELRDCDRLAINDELNVISGIGYVTNFTSDVVTDRDESGSYSYYDILINHLPNTPYDANDDGTADIIDLVRIKKYIANRIWLPNVIIKRLDTDGDDRVAAVELAEARKALLNKRYSPYDNDLLIVELVTEHPGVAEMDAIYELRVTDEYGNAVLADSVAVTTNNADVTVDGYTLTVPYSIRASEEKLTVTVTDKDDSTVYGRYDFEFIKYTYSPTLQDDFDILDTSFWSEYASSGSYAVTDGKLTLTSQVGQTVGLTTKNKFEQAYGCFSASIKMPEKALINGAFWLFTDKGKIYKRNRLNPRFSGGEIDIVEYFPTWGNGGGNIWSSTVHWYGWTAGHHRYSGVDNLNSGVDLGNNYHIYSAVWTKQAIYSYLDGKLYRVYDGEGLSDHSDGMQIILSLHGTGEDSDWGGIFVEDDYPDTMKTDWIKVYGLLE